MTGFVGLDGKPTPLRRDEFDKIMRRGGSRGTTTAVPKRVATNLEVGQAVHVLSGPLADFDGQISEVMPESGKVKVMLTIFGRETPRRAHARPDLRHRLAEFPPVRYR